MKKIFIVIFLFIVSINFAQKNYTFNYYTEYLSTNKVNDSIVNIIYGDSLDSSYKLYIFTSNNIIKGVSLSDENIQKSYSFNVTDININNFELSKHVKEYTTGSYYIQNIEFLFKVHCPRYKNYKKEIEVENEINKTTFSFFYNKRKKKCHTKVVVESINSSITKNQPLSFGHGTFCFKCMEYNFYPRIVKNLTLYINDKQQEKFELLNINTTNFSINIE